MSSSSSTSVYQDRVFRSQELTDLLLKLFVNLLRTTDETNGGKSVAPIGQSFLSRLYDSLVIRESQVVVRAQVQDRFAIANLNPHFLGRLNHAFGFIQSAVKDFSELLFKMFLK